MFHHSDNLKFNGQVSRPDPAFADILLSQSGGKNDELAMAILYLTQSFSARQLHPCKYDALFDITELQSI
jgi:Mn-containing catalase